MPEVGFQELSSSRSGLRVRDTSPDSVIFTLESNFSLFSSASASVDRCSFASDAYDRDSLASEISLHLAAHEAPSCGGVGGSELHETASGPDRDRDPNKLITVYSNTKHAPAPSRLFRKGEKAKVQKEESKATTEVEDDIHLLDSARSSFSLALKECQERRSRSEAISKKPDRRRPASLDLNNVIATSSPRLGAMKKSSISSRRSGSPFSAGVIAADGLSIRSNGPGLAFPARTEHCMARSVSVHGCSEGLAQSSLPSQDEKLGGVKDAATDISSAVSRRDMATQMSPEHSNHSPRSGRASFSASTPSALAIVELQSMHSSNSEVRDVQVDERVTVTRWTKKHRARNQRKSSEIIDDWRKKSVDAGPSGWDVSEVAKSISKAKREEARINAWENLQKAKAEAEIRKLEVKLEKKRSSSMDKIMNKLRSAQKKAQEMRTSVLSNQARQVSRTSHKVISFRRTRQMGSLSGCFTCHAF